ARWSRGGARCALLEDVEAAVPGGVASGQEGRPGRPGVRRQARAGDALAAAVDQRRQVGQLARREQRIEDLPVGAVPADDQDAVCHARTLVRASLLRLQWWWCILLPRACILLHMSVLAPPAAATAAVFGSTGLAGRELMRLLASHP